MKTGSTFRSLILACALSAPALHLHSQTVFFSWADQFGGTGYDYGSAMAVDNLGNVYTTGAFRNTVDFDPGSGTTNLVSSGVEDCFVQKTDANGQLVWAVRIGSTGSDIGNEISIDANGYVYVVGSFEGTVDFNPGSGTSNLTSQTGSSSFVLKLTPSGAYDWAKTIGSNLGTTGEGLSVDAQGTCHFAGNFSGTADLDPGAGTTTAITVGNIDIFLVELDSAGNFQWGIHFGGSSVDGCAAITQDVNGEIYMTGYFSGSCDFDPGNGTTTLSATGVDAFVTKYSTSGSLTWAKKIGGGGTDGGSDITVDFTGNVYTTGYFDGTADFDPGAGTVTFTAATGISDAFVSCLDGTGNYSWAAQMGGNSVDAGQSIALDITGNVYTTGRFSTTADFDPGAGTNSLTSSGTYDVYVSKLTSTGTYVWAHHVGGASNDVGNAVGVDANNNVFVTGYFAGSADLDPQGATWAVTSNGQDDMFLLKLSQSGVGIDEATAASALHVFPNPTSGIVTVDVANGSAFSYAVLNAVGAVVLAGSNAAGDNSIDLTNLASGAYILQVGNADGKMSARVIR